MEGNMIKGVHHYCIRVPDFEKSLKFYTQALGYKIKLLWQNGAMLILPDGAVLEVFRKENPDQKTGYRHIALATDYVDEVYKNALESGCKPLIAPKDIVIEAQPPMKARIAFIIDPSGEEIELFHEYK